MIRINLLSGRGHLPAGLVNIVAVSGLLMVCIYWGMRFVPADFLADEDPEMVFLEEPVVHLDEVGQRGREQTIGLVSDLSQADTLIDPTERVELTAESVAKQSAEAIVDTQLAESIKIPANLEQTEKKQIVKQAVVASPVKPKLPVSIPRNWPYRSDACLRAIQLSNQLPATLRFSSLSSQMDGYFTISGFSQIADIKILQDFSDSLMRTAGEAELSYQNAATGDKRPYHFSIDGLLASSQQITLTALSPQAANKLLRQVAGQAHQSGLDSLYMEEPIQIPLASNLTQYRQKIWALGSFHEIGVFIAVLTADQEATALRELAVSQIGPKQINQLQMRLYTALDFVVNAEGEE